MSSITRTVFVIERSHRGFQIRTSINVAGCLSPVDECGYQDLTFSELVDVVLAHLDQRRPGDELVAQPAVWRQPPLWAD